MNKKYDVVIKKFNDDEFRMLFITTKAKNFADEYFKDSQYYNIPDKYVKFSNENHELLNNTLGVLLTNNIKVVSI